MLNEHDQRECEWERGRVIMNMKISLPLYAWREYLMRISSAFAVDAAADFSHKFIFSSHPQRLSRGGGEINYRRNVVNAKFLYVQLCVSLQGNPHFSFSKILIELWTLCCCHGHNGKIFINIIVVPFKFMNFFLLCLTLCGV